MRCSHDIPLEVFTSRGVTVFAGRYDAGKTLPLAVLRFCLTGHEGLPPLTATGVTLPKSLQSMSLMLDWRDMEGAPLTTQDWRTLVTLIRQTRRPLFVGCAMGHGRTGTALAILAHFLGVKMTDPVKWVREVYCGEAVESRAQITYLEAITGRKSTAKLAKMPYIYMEKKGYSSEYIPSRKAGEPLTGTAASTFRAGSIWEDYEDGK